jgi:hypothetical protein
MEDFAEKINIDELYENKKNRDLNQINIYNKILNRIHTKIKITSRKNTDNICFFLVPEIILGVPKYEQSGCILYLYNKLKENKFNIQYIHPNLFIISWGHFIPSYVRNEYKKKTGIAIDEFGNIIKEEDGNEDEFNGNSFFNFHSSSSSSQKEGNNKANKGKNYTPINKFQSQDIIYDEDLLNICNLDDK